MSNKLNKWLCVIISIILILNLCSCSNDKNLDDVTSQETTIKEALDFNSPILQEELGISIDDEDSDETEDVDEVGDAEEKRWLIILLCRL